MISPKQFQSCFIAWMKDCHTTAKGSVIAIEVKLHWKLDVALKEDACRIRRGDAAENFSKIRHVALNLLNQDQSFKAGIQRKQKRAGRSESYLSKVLTGQAAS